MAELTAVPPVDCAAVAVGTTDLAAPSLAAAGEAHTSRSGSMCEPSPMPKASLPVKASTTSTLFISSTISMPDNDELSLGVATVLHCQITQDTEACKRVSAAIAPIARLFDETSYAIDGKEATIRDEAEGVRIEAIYQFIIKTFKLAQFSPECNLISLVLINRLIASSKMPLHATNWRLLLLTSLLVAQKVWDDSALANIDFPTVWNHATAGTQRAVVDLKVVNQLERKLLELLQYNVTVSSSLYAKYYFELRSLAIENKLDWRLAPLTKEQARKLEATSASKREEFRAGKAWGVGADYSRSRTVADLTSVTGSALGSPTPGRAILS